MAKVAEWGGVPYDILFHGTRNSRALLQQPSRYYREPFKVTPFAVFSITWQIGILQTRPYMLSNFHIDGCINKGCLGNFRLFMRNYLFRGS